MPKKVIVRLKGGMGNQLFCYAAARRLAWVNDAELVIDAVSGFKFDHLYRRKYALNVFCIPARLATPREQMEPLGRARRHIAHKLAEQKPLGQRRYIKQVAVNFDSGILELRLQEGTTFFDPFGQSERYFSDICELLQRDLVMKVRADQALLAMAAHIESTLSVAVHMRWFDADNAGYSSNMSLKYYAEAISQLLSRIGRAHFFVFSDRPQQSAAFLAPLLQGRSYTIVSQDTNKGSEVADFWLMRQCRHFIIGNSTFAWWAAWLKEKSDLNVQIFAPVRCIDTDQSVTAWGFPGLLPERWTLL